MSPAVSAATPAPVIAEPKNTGCTRPCLACAASARAQPAGTDSRPRRARRRPAAPRRARRARSASRAVNAASSAAVGPERAARRAQPGHRAHRHDRRGQPLGDARKHPSGVRARPVDLVHEDEGGDPQPPQRPHQHPGLRLDALDGGDHQHGAVEHAEHPLHLGDEIRVPGRVDQVDRDVADDERHHGGLDRDAALPLQRQRIGLGAARIDAADLVDDTGGMQQPLGQAGLAGVNMRQNPQIQRSHEASCPYALA